MLISDLAEEKKAEYIEIFNEIDADGSGKITQEELSRAMRAIGQDPTDDDVMEMIREFDDDGDNQIDLHEFMQLMARKEQNMDTDEEL